ncbi:MAG: polyprenyl synthetase family protein [Phycisphaerales bacterium]
MQVRGVFDEVGSGNGDRIANVAKVVSREIERVIQRFDGALESDLPAVERLVRHVEGYRGKMLRPTLAILSSLATRDNTQHDDAGTPEDVITVAAVVEMVHMATLVHDDVLDEADTRRRAATVNALEGNETAVILGDLLIASAYALCSTLPTPDAARVVAKASVVTCTGELLQLSRRNDLSLDEATYIEIIDRKTAALIAAACRLGVIASGPMNAARLAHADRLERFGRLVGRAFQIQDDVLDLVGDERVVGKSLGVDAAKGKATLPLIAALNDADAWTRGEILELLDRAAHAQGRGGSGVSERLIEAGGVAFAQSRAKAYIDEAKAELTPLPASGARHVLEMLADAVVTRQH